MEQIHVKLVPTIQFEAPFELVGRSGVGVCVEAIAINEEFTKCTIWIDMDHMGSRVCLLSIMAKYHPDFENQSQAVIDAIANNQSVSQRIAQFARDYDYAKSKTRRNKHQQMLS